jgi:hypothetical protein
MQQPIEVTSYADLRQLYRAFNDGKFSVAIVAGRCGTAKSSLAEEEVKDIAIINCHATDLGIYKQLLKHKDEDILFEDIDGLLARPGAVALLKQLTDTRRKVKTIGWYSDRTDDAAKVSNGIPDHFETESRVLITLNELNDRSPNVKALLDRGIVVIFNPSNHAIHEYVLEARFFTETEIIGFVAERLNFITNLSIRDYLNAKQLKKAKMDWRSFLLRAWKVDVMMAVVIELMNRKDLTPTARLHEFKVRTGKSRRLWFYHLRKYKKAVGEEGNGAKTGCTFAPAKGNPPENGNNGEVQRCNRKKTPRTTLLSVEGNKISNNTTFDPAARYASPRNKA